MQQPKVRKPRSTWWRWVIVVLVGAGLGILGAKGYMFLRVSKTSIGQLMSPPFGGRKFVRVLVLGEDNTSKLRANGHGLSDTIMVAAIDLDAKTVRAISIPRDSKVDIPGHGVQKINAANAYGGPKLAIEMVQQTLGIPVDYYIKTDIAGLKGIVDLVGGVGIDVEKDMHYTDRHGGLYINLKKGYRHLNGDKALQYVRFRHDALGDIWRMQRQQKFLRALARQIVAPKNLVHLPAIAEEMYGKHYIDTDMNLTDLGTVLTMARDVPQEKVETETAPGTTQTIGRASYYIIDPEKTAEVVKRMLQENSGTTVKLEVLNGSGVVGLARKAADQLQQSGYTIDSTGNAPSFNHDKTQIIVHNDKAPDVEVARMLRCSDVQYDHDSSAKTDMTVIVGKDYYDVSKDLGITGQEQGYGETGN